MARLAAAVILALSLAATSAVAESASEAVRAFGLVGTWSPDCAGAFRTIYAAPAGAAPSVRVTMGGEEIASSEIRETERLGPNRLKWSSVIKTWSLTDRPHENWMPEPGEVWETVIEKSGDRIRPMLSQRQDGQKISVKDGLIYNGAIAPDGHSVVWRNSGKATLPLARCSSDSAAAASPFAIASAAAPATAKR